MSIGIGAVLIIYQKRNIRVSRGSILALGTALLFGIGALIDKAIIHNFSAIFYTGFNYLVTTLFLLVPTYLRFRKTRIVPNQKTHGFMLFSALFYSLSAFSFYSSYHNQGYVSLTGIIGQLQIPLVVLYGIIILREKGNLVKKISATVLMIIGAYLLRV
jgi:uncharacterized membrane protein